MSRYHMADLEAFVNDLDQDEIVDVLEIVAVQDELAMTADGKPRWTGDQITLIMKIREILSQNADGDDQDNED